MVEERRINREIRGDEREIMKLSLSIEKKINGVNG